jgi:hypothetical protein
VLGVSGFSNGRRAVPWFIPFIQADGAISAALGCRTVVCLAVCYHFDNARVVVGLVAASWTVKYGRWTERAPDAVYPFHQFVLPSASRQALSGS